MNVTVQVPFVAVAPLIIVPCIVRRGNQALILRMALDTGASFVLLAHEPLQALGYDLTIAPLVRLYGFQVQPANAVLVTLERFGIIGAEVDNVECLAFPLAPQLGVDGLVGLNYLRRFHRIALDFTAGTLVLECP